ncbi:hypothetical protein FNO01nite_30560 [Flavobacterium noncentrifugens]|uniref:Uncharacterized protein n=1 Tax=Flavobacterium noncentrifugens TaxID=1128970 RepID=A0A1G9BWB7_9FLAO|nr:hypothetical protein [Flavobacterium noncentrifugens]GEP52384.1 hypothetical protein FNO01nite_30560 [Flavobacterium noncentrifugens]SDK43464.1 hypothetical protein SAMN04487935_3370 [Flavobacterium noncentrifugens]
MKNRAIQYNDRNDSGEVLDLKIQPVRGSDGKIISGIVIGNTLEQNKALILIAHQGDFKFNPDLGVGLEDILLSEEYLTYRHLIREHMAKDGLKVESLDFYQNKPFKLIASYD